MPLTQIDPYYRAGTATFNATATVTGQGTAWLAEVEPGDQIFNRLGQMAVVLSVNSNTSITLVAPFAGTAQAAQAYTIYRVPDSVRLENFSQRMVNLLKGGNLSSLGDLVLEADRGIHSTGPGVLATHVQTPAARQLFDDTSFAAMVTTLGLLPVQSSNTDGTANRLMRTGAFGWGGNGPPVITSGLASDIDRTGQYYVSGLSDMPPVPQTWNLLVLAQSSSAGRHVQMAWPVAGQNQMFLRSAINGVYADWTRLDVQRGSNANGEWVRFPDGTQICWRSATVNIAIGTSIAGGFRTSSIGWTYPAGFSETSVLFADCADLNTFAARSYAAGLGSGAYFFEAVTSQPAADRQVNLLAVGRYL